LYELGAIFLLDSYKTISGLAKQYNVSLTKRSEKTTIISNGKPVSPMKFMRAEYSWMEIIRAQFRLFRVLSKLKKVLSFQSNPILWTGVAAPWISHIRRQRVRQRITRIDR
jgi:hypothetical protein